MFNMKGEVIGIVSFILTPSGGFDGMGFAMSSNTAKELLLEQKSPWSGLSLQLITGDLAKAFNIPQSAGFMVQKVALKSPGQRLGLRAGKIPVLIAGEELLIGGDVILEVQGIPIADDIEYLRKIRKLMQGLKKGDKLELKVLRDGAVVTLSSTDYIQ